MWSNIQLVGMQHAGKHQNRQCERNYKPILRRFESETNKENR